MAQKRNSGNTAPDPRCTRCGHLASEHGRSGSRPCMAVVGELGKREFCSCNELRLHAVMAA